MLLLEGEGMVHDCYYRDDDDDEGREERGRAGGIEAEVWRRVAIALHFGGFYLVKAAREECHCTSFEKNHTISRRYLLAEQKQQSLHATSSRVRGQP